MIKIFRIFTIQLGREYIKSYHKFQGCVVHTSGAIGYCVCG